MSPELVSEFIETAVVVFGFLFLLGLLLHESRSRGYQPQPKRPRGAIKFPPPPKSRR